MLNVGIEVSFICIARERPRYILFGCKTICLLVSKSSLWRVKVKYDVPCLTELALKYGRLFGELAIITNLVLLHY